MNNSLISLNVPQISNEEKRLNGKKYLFRVLDNYISDLLWRGLIAFGVTINLIDELEALNGSGRHFRDYNLFKKRPTYSELLDGGWSEEEIYLFYQKENLCCALSGTDFIDVLYGSIELSQKGVKHFHVIVFYRTVFISNEGLIRQINKEL